MKLEKDNVFCVEVDDKFALIDRNAGVIHVVDEINHNKWNSGEEFETISTEKSIIQASSGDPGKSGDAPGHNKRLDDSFSDETA